MFLPHFDVLCDLFVTGLPEWQTQSESAFHLLVSFIFVFFLRFGKSLACHSPAKWCLLMVAYSIGRSAHIFLGSRG